MQKPTRFELLHKIRVDFTAGHGCTVKHAASRQPKRAEVDPSSSCVQVENGACKLLYSHFQLHVRRRKQIQVELLQHEIATVHHAFNKQFEVVRLKKRKALDSMEDRFNRIAEVQETLGSSEQPVRPQEAPEEDAQSFLEVADSEIAVPKWITPADRYAS